MISQRNTTQSNIANGAEWAGGIDDVASYAGVSISVYSDVDLNVYVDQALDHTSGSWEKTKTIAYTATDEFSGTVTLQYRYYRLPIENLSGADSTEMRACSKFHAGLPIEEPLETTSAVTNLGAKGNLADSVSIAPGATTVELDTTLWSVGSLFIEDGSTGSFDGYSVEISLDAGVSWQEISTIFMMVNAAGTLRVGSYTGVDLRGIKLYRIKNTSSTDTYTDVVASLVGG